MLAAGPLPLVEAYAEVMEAFEINTGVSDPKRAYYTNDESSGLVEVALLIFGRQSHVVAPKFNARRIA